MQIEELLEKKETEKDCQKYLFVCTGNTCRSPMAAAVFNKLHMREGMIADSCGLSASWGQDMSKNARTALESIGIYDTFHSSKPVSEELLFNADVIVGMTATHAARLLMAFPQYARKITSMPLEIEDPFGGDEEVYKICLMQICSALEIGFAENEEDEDSL